MEGDIRVFEDVVTGKLVVGDHNTITLLGSSAQTKLQVFTKNISDILLNDNREIEYLIHDIVQELDSFQSLTEAKKSFSLFKSEDSQRNACIKEYNMLLAYIDKMSLSLKLQEAQLLKDISILEELEIYIIEAEKHLEIDITEAGKVLEQKKTDGMSSLDDWYNRLEKRVEDLRISHAVCIQSKAQLSLMQENNNKLIDKILATITGTIPIWRNQLTLLLGIEKYNRDIATQQKLANITEAYIKQNSKKIRKLTKKINKAKELDIDKLKIANRDLADVLNELALVEKNNIDIKLELSNTLV